MSTQVDAASQEDRAKIFLNFVVKCCFTMEISLFDTNHLNAMLGENKLKKNECS